MTINESLNGVDRVHFDFFSRFLYPSHSRILEHVVNTSANPIGVAVDPPNDHVFWVPYYNNGDHGNKVFRCNSDGTNVVVFTSLNDDTFMIRLDLINRWMYLGSYIRGVSKSRFDLTDISVIVHYSHSAYTITSSMDIG
ncbi:Hypothetical predicted protein [Mytilus galloprovincialis]|uniref:Uncharacterized protein n=1 Tax=Mytilus galloprovincialis TaxID=29158 RepID=A0A8B6H0N5_MYTGA|nr:Hypothetical predicted protein [Mytilus galloprovincialis]